MQILQVFRGARLLGVCLLVLLAVSFCYADEKEVEVVGFGECGDCKQSNIKPGQAFLGLSVKIECKTENGKFKTRGIGALNEQGKFLVSLPDGLEKEECFAKLHSADSKPCPSPNGVIEGSKIVLQAKTDSKHTYVLPGKLKFSPETCTSAFFWWYYWHPWYKPYHPWYKPQPQPQPQPEPVPPQEPPPETPVTEQPPPETPVTEQPQPQTPVYYKHPIYYKHPLFYKHPIWGYQPPYEQTPP